MADIAWRSWLLSGLTAGVISNVSGIALGHFVLGQAYVDRFFSHFPAPPTKAVLFQHVGIRLGFGLLLMFHYVGFRPRFGAGGCAVAVSALTFFVGVFVPLSMTLRQFGILTGREYWIAFGWGLAEALSMAWAGAAIYREAAR